MSQDIREKYKFGILPCESIDMQNINGIPQLPNLENLQNCKEKDRVIQLSSSIESVVLGVNENKNDGENKKAINKLFVHP